MYLVDDCYFAFFIVLPRYSPSPSIPSVAGGRGSRRTFAIIGKIDLNQDFMTRVVQNGGWWL